MAEEEKLAHDLYVTFAAKYETTSFSRISNAETCHLTEVRIVLTRYSITDPMTGKAVGTFATVSTQQLYNKLVAQRTASVDAAYAAARTVEKTDIADLNKAKTGLSAPDVLAVYTHLLARVPAPPRGIRRLFTGLTILATSGSGDRVRTFQFDLYTPLGMLSSMEPTATSSSSPSPQSAVATSLFQRLRGVFGGSPTDGSLGSKIKGERALEVVRGGASLLDVRESSEWRSGHAPGAIHVPLGDIDKAPRRLPKGRPVVVMCASGMRSRTAAKQLRSLGYDAASLSGGIAGWQRAGGEIR